MWSTQTCLERPGEDFSNVPEKRVALLAHKDDENDVIMAHVDRIVKKKEVPKTLRDKWKPIRMELAKPAGGDQRKAKEREISSEPSREGRLKVAPAGEEEVFLKLRKLQFKVRFVGFGPKDDLWYEEAKWWKHTRNESRRSQTCWVATRLGKKERASRKAKRQVLSRQASQEIWVAKIVEEKTEKLNPERRKSRKVYEERYERSKLRYL